MKEFFKKHRDEFDTREPSDRVWSEIERAMFKTPGKRRIFISEITVWRAAAVLFFGLSSYLFISNQYGGRKLQGELSDIESFYGHQIAEKVAFIDKLDNGYEDDQFTQDAQKLDAMYEVLREEMRTNPSKKVKDALILNMLIRIDLLNQQIKRLEDHRKSETSSEEI
jgi:hypothetical protein